MQGVLPLLWVEVFHQLVPQTPVKDGHSRLRLQHVQQAHPCPSPSPEPSRRQYLC